MVRMTNPERSARTRAALLQAAAKIFDRHGYLGASLTDIVNAAETTKGALYFHFASKDALAAAVVHEQYAAWPALVQRAQQRSKSPLEQLVALSYDVARSFQDDVIVRAGTRLAAERTVIDAELPTPYVGWMNQTAAILLRARAAGELREDIDPDAAAYALVASFFGLQAVANVLTGRADLQQRLDDFWELVLPALASPGTPLATPADLHATTP